MEAEATRSIALFYYFALLDDESAIELTAKTLNRLRILTKKPSLFESGFTLNSLIVKLTQAYLQKLKKSSTEKISINQSKWIMEKNLELGPWRQYHKESLKDELLVLIWSRILKFSDLDISLGLGISEGTVRHRVARGLRQLGSMYKLDALNE